MDTQHTGAQMEHGEGHGDNRRRRSLGDAVKGIAAAQASEQKHRATESLGRVAHALRRTTDVLREDGRTNLARYVEQASDRLERFSQRIDEQDLQQVLHRVQEFAHRRPALFIGAAFGVGLLGGRLLRSSPPAGRQTASGPGFHAGSRDAQAGMAGGQPLTPTSDLPGGRPLF